MDALQAWGVGLILTLQQLSPGLDGLMRFLSFLGQEEFYAVLVPFVYWCVDTTLGARLLAALIVSDFANGFVKLAFHAPRPYWVSTEVRALSVEPSYGIPSGHAQTGIPCWGQVARRVARPWAPAAATAVVLGVSLSRVYLGVHFPHDVLAGWVIGVALLVAAVRMGPRLAAWWGARPPGAQSVARA